MVKGTGTPRPNQYLRSINILNEFLNPQPLVSRFGTPPPDQCLRCQVFALLEPIVVPKVFKLLKEPNEEFIVCKVHLRFALLSPTQGLQEKH